MRVKQSHIEDARTNALFCVLGKFVEGNCAPKVIEGALVQHITRNFNKLMSYYLKKIG